MLLKSVRYDRIKTLYLFIPYCVFCVLISQVISGHGEGSGVPLYVLVCVVCGVCDWFYSHQRFWSGLSAGLLLLPAVRHSAADQTIPHQAANVGLPHHLQRWRNHLQKRLVCEWTLQARAKGLAGVGVQIRSVVETHRTPRARVLQAHCKTLLLNCQACTFSLKLSNMLVR